MSRTRIIVIAPGRGAYTRETSGYLNEYEKTAEPYIKWMDNIRSEKGYRSLTELDSLPFKTKIHMLGENASTLIYGCSLSDFLSIDRKKYKIVGVLGNSMGWYTALVLSGAISIKNGFYLIQRMGSMMEKNIKGGQIIYPIIDENLIISRNKQDLVLKLINESGAYVSINLGGYIVIGGSQKALDILLKKLPSIDDFPFQIPLHAAFHTPLMSEVSKIALEKIPLSYFKEPKIPLINGQGHIYMPYSADRDELRNYTLTNQVLRPYNFTVSIEVALKEFCPDNIVLLGPGNTLGGSIGQTLIKNNWLNIKSKESFIQLQKQKPFLISMGDKKQRSYLS